MNDPCTAFTAEQEARICELVLGDRRHGLDGNVAREEWRSTLAADPAVHHGDQRQGDDRGEPDELERLAVRLLPGAR
ncbi:hypothetical protein GCM10010434_080610 [Winogradskya humida]